MKIIQEHILAWDCQQCGRKITIQGGQELICACRIMYWVSLELHSKDLKEVAQMEIEPAPKSGNESTIRRSTERIWTDVPLLPNE